MNNEQFLKSEVFPQEFVENLGESLQSTLMEWLGQQGAPNELVTALDDANVLQRYAAWMRADELSKVLADDLPVTVARATHYVRLFGGVFGDERAAEETVKWGVR